MNLVSLVLFAVFLQQRFGSTQQAVAWGTNSEGQLGTSPFAGGIVPVPTLVDSTTSALFNSSVISIAAGTSHTVAIRSDGKAVAWGNNDFGQLGNGFSGDLSVPALVSTASVFLNFAVISIAAGTSHTVAIRSDGKAVAWGNNDFGQLGDGSTNQRLVPTLVSTAIVLFNSSVISIAAGTSYTVAIRSDGKAVAWGSNDFGQLGDGSTNQRLVPTLVSTAIVLFNSSVISIAAGTSHTVAIRSDGKAVAWGYNINGQLGDGSQSTRLVPTLVDASGVLSGFTVIAVSAGFSHTVAIRSDGKAVAWGNNAFGQVGDGSTGIQNQQKLVPTLVDASGVLSGFTVIAVSAGFSHTVAIRSDGKAVAWGSNGSGQIGDQTINQRNSPTLVSTAAVLSNRFVVSISAGNSYSVAHSRPYLCNGCSGNGICSGDNVCTCESGWKGANCSMFDCSMRNQCSGGNGNCSGPNTCTCESGWKGENCSIEDSSSSATSSSSPQSSSSNSSSSMESSDSKTSSSVESSQVTSSHSLVTSSGRASSDDESEIQSTLSSSMPIRVCFALLFVLWFLTE